jgi:hypothetical protein
MLTCHDCLSNDQEHTDLYVKMILFLESAKNRTRPVYFFPHQNISDNNLLLESYI